MALEVEVAVRPIPSQLERCFLGLTPHSPQGHKKEDLW